MKPISIRLVPKSIFSNLLLILHFWSYVMFMFTGSALIQNLGIVWGIITLVYLFFFTEVKRQSLSLSCLLCAVGFIMAMNSLLVGNYGLASVIREVFTYTTTACLLLDKRINKKITLAIFYCTALLIWVRILQVGYPYNDIFAKGRGSRNYVLVVLFAALFPYYVVCTREKISAGLFPGILCVFLSIYTLGRGSTLAAAVLVVGVCFKNIFIAKKQGKKSKKIVFLSILILVVAVVLFANATFVEDYLYRFSTILLGLKKNPRIITWSEYLQWVLSSPGSFLFGENIFEKNFYMFTRYGNNLHNSFLMLHSYAGLLGFFLVMVGIMRAYKSMLTNGHFDMLAFVTAFLLKAFTDWCFPIQITDTIVLFVLIMPIMDRSSRDCK